jgi:uncharacterized RDD family membrane protein YckC
MDHRKDPETPELAARQAQESDAGEATLVATAGPPAREPLSDSAQAETYHRAGFWLRLVAFVIDLAVLGAFSVFLLVSALLVSVAGADFSSFESDSFPSFSLFSLCEIAEIVAVAAYFTILHGETGQTIGKSVAGVKVCTLDGQPLGYGHALLRFTAYGFSFFALGLGFLWVGLNPGKRGWHDLLTGTMVVVDRG